MLEAAIVTGPFPADTFRDRSYLSFNREASRELATLRRFERHFEAVGYFEAYAHNALQVFAGHRDAEFESAMADNLLYS